MTEQENEPNCAIINPWIIIYQPKEDGPIKTILAGKPGASYEEFSIIVCDLIRHIAAGFKVTEADVFNWVRKEFENPTADITAEWQRPSGRA